MGRIDGEGTRVRVLVVEDEVSLAETIRADQKLSHTPIIALSAMISPAAIERGRLAGFHDYVAKFDRPGLIAALKEQTTEVRQAA